MYAVAQTIIKVSIFVSTISHYIPLVMYGRSIIVVISN